MQCITAIIITKWVWNPLQSCTSSFSNFSCWMLTLSPFGPVNHLTCQGLFQASQKLHTASQLDTLIITGGAKSATNCRYGNDNRLFVAKNSQYPILEGWLGFEIKSSRLILHGNRHTFLSRVVVLHSYILYMGSWKLLSHWLMTCFYSINNPGIAKPGHI